MIKRAALARALALDPDIVFLDEPTSGLDPIGAAEFDELVAKLRDTMGLTVYMVTHDLDSLFSVCDRVAVLGNKKVLVEGTIEDMLASDEPWVKSYFRGKRARQLDLDRKRRRIDTQAAWKPEPTTSSSASSRSSRSSRPSASSTGRRRSATGARRRMLRVRIPGSASGPRPRQRGAVQRRQGRRRPARLYRRDNPDGGHRRHRDRPADADHQVDAGRYRPCRPDRPGQHRAQGRRPQGAEPARRGRGSRARSPRSPPIRRP